MAKASSTKAILPEDLHKHFPEQPPQELLNAMMQVQPPYSIAEPTYQTKLYWLFRNYFTGMEIPDPPARSPFATPEPPKPARRVAIDAAANQEPTSPNA